MKQLKGQAHNVAHQFFSSLWIWKGDTMEDCIFNGARVLDIHSVTLDVTSCTVEPMQMTLESLVGGLKMSKNSLERRLKDSGIEPSYIKSARMEVLIPDFKKTLLIVKSILEGQDGKLYVYENFYVSVTGNNFDPFKKEKELRSITKRVEVKERGTIANRVYDTVMKIRSFLTKTIV